MVFVVAAASHDRTFVDTVVGVDRSYEAAYEPIRATSFRDYGTRLKTSDIEELTQEFLERLVSVNVFKLNG